MSEYSKKYPWLKINSLYSSDGSDYDTMDDIPEGWRIAFGDLLCEELDAAIKKAGIEDEFGILEIKEKYGRLVVYANHYIPEIDDILCKYSVISKNICIMCGKPDVSTIMLGSWTAPYCEDCFYVRPFSYREIYEDLKYAGDSKIRNNITMMRKDGNEYIANKIYLKDTADKIRARWLEREIGRS